MPSGTFVLFFFAVSHANLLLLNESGRRKVRVIRKNARNLRGEFAV